MKITTYQEIIDAVYGEQWNSLTLQSQTAVLQLLRYLEDEGDIIMSDASLKDIYIALDDALLEYCGESISKIVDGPRTRKYVDLRVISYKIVTEYTGMIAKGLYYFFGQTRDRTTIHYALKRFDDLYKYDRQFHEKYDDILKLFSKKLKTCQRES